MKQISIVGSFLLNLHKIFKSTIHVLRQHRKPDTNRRSWISSVIHRNKKKMSTQETEAAHCWRIYAIIEDKIIKSLRLLWLSTTMNTSEILRWSGSTNVTPIAAVQCLLLDGFLFGVLALVGYLLWSKQRDTRYIRDKWKEWAEIQRGGTERNKWNKK